MTGTTKLGTSHVVWLEYVGSWSARRRWRRRRECHCYQKVTAVLRSRVSCLLEGCRQPDRQDICHSDSGTKNTRRSYGCCPKRTSENWRLPRRPRKELSADIPGRGLTWWVARVRSTATVAKELLPEHRAHAEACAWMNERPREPKRKRSRWMSPIRIFHWTGAFQIAEHLHSHSSHQKTNP